MTKEFPINCAAKTIVLFLLFLGMLNIILLQNSIAGSFIRLEQVPSNSTGNQLYFSKDIFSSSSLYSKIYQLSGSFSDNGDYLVLSPNLEATKGLFQFTLGEEPYYIYGCDLYSITLTAYDTAANGDGGDVGFYDFVDETHYVEAHISDSNEGSLNFRIADTNYVEEGFVDLQLWNIFGWCELSISSIAADGIFHVDDYYEQSENDTINSAYDLPVNTSLKEYHGYGYQVDEDWFRIAPQEKELLIQCNFNHSEGDINLALYDYNGNLLKESTSTNDDEVLEFKIQRADAYYYIKVFNGDSGVNYGPKYDLMWSTTSNSVPNEPNSPRPIDGATNVSRFTDLDWSCSDPDGETLYYTVYFEKGDSTPDTVVKNDESGSSVSLPTLDGNANYFWRVKAYDHYGGITEGPVWEFSTKEVIPSPPSSLNANASSTSMNLIWSDNSDNEDGFRIYRDGVQIASTETDVTSYLDTGLRSDTRYCYRVSAYNSGGESSKSNEDCEITDKKTPSSPSNLAANASSSSQINLTWADNSNNEEGFRIYRDGSQIGSVGAGTISYSDSGLESDTQYCYRASAYNSGGESSKSNEDCATTDMQSPASPGGLSATSGSATSIDLSWTDNSDNEEGFRIYRGGSQVGSVGAGTTSYSDSGLESDTQYCYRVSAYNTTGESSQSAEDCATTYMQSPASPGGLSATSGSATSIDLSWTDNSNNEEGFRIYRDGSQIGSVGAGTISYSDSGLESDTQYCYRVSAYNSGGESSKSNEDCATTDMQSPASPGGLSATSGSATSIDLSWTDNSDNEEGFRIYRGGSQVGSVGAGTTSYSDTGLESDTQYCYRVSAYNTAGESSQSSEACATTGTEVVTPASPGGLSATSGSATSIDLSWTDNSDNEEGFRIYRGGSQVGSVGAGTTSYSDTGLESDTQYCYRVSAYNTAGESSQSSEACATTGTEVVTPASPGGLSATSGSATSIDLSWTDNSDNEEGFRIYRGGSQVGSVGAGTTSYSDSGLESDTQYCYRVSAYNTAGESSQSSEACATTGTEVVTPASPGGLSATSGSATSIDLSWTDNSDNEEGFRIYRGGSQVGSVGADTTSYSDSGLESDTQYCYRVSAYNTAGESSQSSEACATTGTEVVTPASPGGLSATSGSATSIDLSWTDNSDNEEGFRIYRGGSQVGSVGAGTTSYSDTGLESDTQYCYRVSAYNTAGESSQSSEACATTDIANNLLLDKFEGSTYGTINGATYTDNGYEGQGLLFDEVDDSVAYDASYFPTEGSFEAYVYLDGDNSNWKDIIFDSNARANWDSQNHIALYLNNDGTLQFKFFGTGVPDDNVTINSISSLQLNKWYSVGASWGSEGLYLYINGSLEASNVSFNQAWDGGEPVYLGDCPDDDWAGSEYYNSLFGILDSVRTSDKQNDITYTLGGDCTDADGDGYYAESGCGTEVDCNDNDANIYPGAPEICTDELDNDCDGDVDGNDSDCPETCTDADGDGYYAESGCGTVVDCNDNDAGIHPGASEKCNLKDDDCDGEIDEGLDCEDANNNGMPDNIEVTDSSSDIDGDGTSDFEDSDSVSFQCINENGEIVEIYTSAGSLAEIENLSPDQDSIPQTGKPEASFPYGIFRYKITGLDNGAETTVTYVLPENLPDNGKLYKITESGWEKLSFEQGDTRNEIIVTLNDGNTETDGDGTQDGVIADTSTIAYVTEPEPDNPGGGGGGCFIKSLY